jgi:glycine cleavage system pyridoxal-binding protein P
MNYIPVTENDKKDMLKQIGVKSVDELLADC